MEAWLQSTGLKDWLTAAQLLTLLKTTITLIVGLILARFAGFAVGRVLEGRLTRQSSTIARRLVFYGLTVLVVATVAHQLGFELGVLLGAAGILTVAIGFASQTSASNLISGLFLIAERPFVLGDVIRVADLTGEVLSIDLLSVKLRTFDNLYVRVPNEDLVKSRITNLTHFPVRRNDLLLSVAYKEDLTKIREILFEIADRNTMCLDEPVPIFIFKKFGDSGLEIQFSVWSKRDNYLTLNNSIQQEIKRAFEEHGIEIPFPQRALSSASATEPFPVRLVDEAATDDPHRC